MENSSLERSRFLEVGQPTSFWITALSAGVYLLAVARSAGPGHGGNRAAAETLHRRDLL